MTKVAVSGRQVDLPSGRTVQFDLEVGEVLSLRNVLIVRLDVPPGLKMNRNVYGVRLDDGQVLWRVPERKLVYEDSPYTGLRKEGESAVLLNWDGLELKIDPESGKILEEKHGR